MALYAIAKSAHVLSEYATPFPHVNRAVGVYSSRLEIREMASAGVRGLKTLVKGWGLIWGNLCSMYFSTLR